MRLENSDSVRTSKRACNESARRLSPTAVQLAVLGLQISGLARLILINAYWINHFRTGLPFSIDEAGYLQRSGWGCESHLDQRMNVNIHTWSLNTAMVASITQRSVGRRKRKINGSTSRLGFRALFGSPGDARPKSIEQVPQGHRIPHIMAGFFPQ